MQTCTPVTWDIQYDTSPTAVRYCKKCKQKTEYISSGEFRVNAQQKNLDIWLIYKCTNCNTTWNNTIYSRVSPQQLDSSLLERFHSNDEILALQYAMNTALLRQNGSEIKLPEYQIVGNDVTLDSDLQIKIRSQYYLPIKLSSIIRRKLGLSQREFEQLYSDRRIDSNTDQDLRKARFSSEVIVNIS